MRSRLLLTTAVLASLVGTAAVPALGAVRERTCFYYANSGWGLWATPNVSCTAAKTVYRDATKHVPAGRFDKTIKVDGYRCHMNFDGGGSGACAASRNRRIRFDVP